MPLTYAKPSRIWLKDHPELSERWLQDRIGEDPSLLGLGDLVLKDRERRQPHAGRLDLLFQHAENNKRYEVELQLGRTDEAHIIRTIEYWDTERKRYPQYDHTAVIVAEDITGRFLNVVSLFNGHIPLVAIQLRAVELAGNISLFFTKVLDEVQLGLIDEDEDIQAPTNREYWEKRGSKGTLALADELLEWLRAIDPSLELKYNKFYIGLARNGQPDNFVVFRPKKDWLRVEIRLDQSEATSAEFDASGLEVMDYDTRWKKYRVRVTKTDLTRHKEFLIQMMARARGESE